MLTNGLVNDTIKKSLSSMRDLVLELYVLALTPGRIFAFTLDLVKLVLWLKTYSLLGEYADILGRISVVFLSDSDKKKFTTSA